jgi:flavodoxin
MKTLVIYYSRTGNTKYVAEMLAKELAADLEELTDKQDRKGIIGWLRAGRDATKGRSTDISDLTKDLKQYQTILIGQPVWAWTMVPAIRALLTKHDLATKNVALFCTMGGNGHEKCFEETVKFMPGANIIAKQAFVNPLQMKMQTDNLVKDFSTRIIESMPKPPIKAPVKKASVKKVPAKKAKKPKKAPAKRKQKAKPAKKKRR